MVAPRSLQRRITMLKTFQIFLKCEKGTTALEYAFIGALISVVVVGSAGAIGTTIGNTFNDVEANL
jgi:Flp pilus assembly pilin Flp